MSEQTDVQRDQVYCAQAERFFEQKNFLLAAKYYGKTTKSFEEISLKFIRLQYVITCLTGNDDASLTTTKQQGDSSAAKLPDRAAGGIAHTRPDAAHQDRKSVV